MCFCLPTSFSPTSLVAQSVKNLPAVQETQVRFLGREDPLEKEMATHASILDWEIPWTEKPGGLQSMGLQESDLILRLNHHHLFFISLNHTFSVSFLCLGSLRFSVCHSYSACLLYLAKRVPGWEHLGLCVSGSMFRLRRQTILHSLLALPGDGRVQQLLLTSLLLVKVLLLLACKSSTSHPCHCQLLFLPEVVSVTKQPSEVAFFFFCLVCRDVMLRRYARCKMFHMHQNGMACRNPCQIKRNTIINLCTNWVRNKEF